MNVNLAMHTNSGDITRHTKRFIREQPNDYMQVCLHMTRVAFQESIRQQGFLEPPPQTFLNYEDKEPSPVPQSRRQNPLVKVEVSTEGEGKSDVKDDAFTFV